ncbi:MAG: hypothetical protein ACFB0B_02470 [Thermonemataceae bacterium]
MAKLYTALSVEQYSEVLKTKSLPLQILEGGILQFEFTEDKSFWVERLKNQDDLDNVADYKYSTIIEFEMKTKVLNSLIKSNNTGRLSKQMVQYYNEFNKPIFPPELRDDDINILCIEDVYESNETEDGISQHWILKTDSKKNNLWHSFSNGVVKISCLGAILGAVEEAKRLL